MFIAYLNTSMEGPGMRAAQDISKGKKGIQFEHKIKGHTAYLNANLRW